MTFTKNDASPTPPVRFRLPTLLWITTILAVLDSLAGPYYKAQTPLARTALLTYWITASLISLATMAKHWRNHTATPTMLGEIKLIGARASRWRFGWILNIASIVLAVAFVGLYSHATVANCEKAPLRGRSFASVLGMATAHALLTGTAIGGMAITIVSVPVYICSQGISFPQMPLKWSQVKTVEWRENRPYVARITYAIVSVRQKIYVRFPMEATPDAKDLFARGLQPTNTQPPLN